MARMVTSCALVFALLVAGCMRYEPIRNVDRAMPPNAAHLSPDRMRDVIIDAGSRFAWTMTAVAPGHLEATHKDGNLAATVDIYYSPTSLRMILKSSQNLFQTPTTVHAHYNLWAGNLEKSIIDELATSS
jgi:hypothetical protein